MNRPNVIGLRRLLTSLKGNSRAHAAIFASLPIVSKRTAGIQSELQFRGNGASGRKRVRKVGRDLKGLYNALGAEPHRIDTFWRSAQVEFLLDFTVDGDIMPCSPGAGATPRLMTISSCSFARRLSART